MLPFSFLLLIAVVVNSPVPPGWSDTACARVGQVQNGRVTAAPGEESLRIGRSPGKNYLEITMTGSGSGHVTVSPPEARCSRKVIASPPDAQYSRPDDFCVFDFAPGTEVVLRAQASGLQNSFEGWLGHCEPTGEDEKGTCRIVMDDEKRVTAVFTRKIGIPLP